MRLALLLVVPFLVTGRPSACLLVCSLLPPSLCRLTIKPSRSPPPPSPITPPHPTPPHPSTQRRPTHTAPHVTLPSPPPIPAHSARYPTLSPVPNASLFSIPNPAWQILAAEAFEHRRLLDRLGPGNFVLHYEAARFLQHPAGFAGGEAFLWWWWWLCGGTEAVVVGGGGGVVMLAGGLGRGAGGEGVCVHVWGARDRWRA